MNADQMKEFVELCKHPAIAGKMGMAIQGDDILCSDGIIRTCKTIDAFGTIATNADGIDQRIYGEISIIPKTFDYQYPERGLWGMVDWARWNVESVFSATITPVIIDARDEKKAPFPTPLSLPIALAKAIIWQHERRRP